MWTNQVLFSLARQGQRGCISKEERHNQVCLGVGVGVGVGACACACAYMLLSLLALHQMKKASDMMDYRRLGILGSLLPY